MKEYYLTNAEIEVLETQADRIAQRIPAHSRLVELGSGYVDHITHTPETTLWTPLSIVQGSENIAGT